MGQLEKLKAPIQMKMVVYVTNNIQIGKITIEFEIGQIPTEEEIINRVIKYKNSELKDQLGENWRFITPEELFNLSMQEKYAATEEYALPISARDYLYKF